jgi:hypothetical protein
MSTESGHWYTRDGKACHTQQTKPGAKNATRNTTLADARKLGLLPSVSAMTGQTKYLSNYLMRETAKACYNMPAIGGEDMQTYINTAVKKAGEAGRKASDFGTIIHGALNKFYTTDSYQDAPITLPDGSSGFIATFVDPAITLLESEGINAYDSEQVLVDGEFGYAGTTDIICNYICHPQRGIGDFKTIKSTPGEPIEGWESHPTQIAAYHYARFGDFDGALCWNLYISTTEPGRVEIKYYDEEKLRKEFDYFTHLCAIWRHINNYDPRF